MGAWSGQEFRCSLVEALCWMSILGCICVASRLHMSTQASICLHGMLPGQHKLFAVLVLNIGIYKPHLVSELDCLIWRVFWSDFHSSEVPGACKAASSVRPPPSHCAGCHAWCPCPQAELGCGHGERREWFVLYALRCTAPALAARCFSLCGRRKVHPFLCGSSETQNQTFQFLNWGNKIWKTPEHYIGLHNPGYHF